MTNVVYGRNYEVYVTRLQSTKDVLHDSSGAPVDLLTYIDGVTKQGISDLLNVPKIDFDYRLVAPDYGKGGVRSVTTAERTVVFTPPTHMEASISYEGASANGAGGSGQITLYNLSEQDNLHIQVGNVITLKAGYESVGELFVAFVGLINDVYTEKEGPNIKTVITCSESSSVKSQGYAQANLKFAKGTSIKEIFERFIEEFNLIGIPEGNFQLNGAVYDKIDEAWVINKPLGQALSDLCRACYYTWLVSAGKLYIMPRDMDRPVDSIVLRPELVIGVIGKRDSSNIPSTIDKTPKPAGIKFKTFYSPDIRPENYIVVPSGVYAGTYKPSKIDIDLGWHGGDWTVDVECDPATTFDSNQ